MSLNFIDGVTVGILLAWVLDVIGYRIGRYLASRGGEQS